MGRQHKKTDLASYKHDLKKIAKQLCYSDEILVLIDKAQTEEEALRAMACGRRSMRS